MDKQLSGLDPKLAETFQRVMNTPIPAPTVKPIVQTPSSGMPTIPTPTPQTPTQPVSTPIPQPANPAPMQPHPKITQAQPGETQKVVVINPQNVDAKNSQVFSSKKKGGKISPVILSLVVVVFLLVYTLVWTKIFNVKLPFLP